MIVAVCNREKSSKNSRIGGNFSSYLKLVRRSLLVRGNGFSHLLNSFNTDLSTQIIIKHEC